MRIYTPAGNDPAPTLVFNHGSTGNGTSREIALRPIDYPPLAEFFVQRGWAVVMPARRGRGGSEGTYDEGFAGVAADRLCVRSGRVAARRRPRPAGHRSRDGRDPRDAVRRPTRVVIGGQSRGGILSVAYAGRRPEQVKGVINFVGGWNGARCDHATHNNQAVFARGARYSEETLWLYGDQDPFYPLSHSRANFAAFEHAGGKGTFLEFPKPATSTGHRIVRASVPVERGGGRVPEAARPPRYRALSASGFCTLIGLPFAYATT
jgi:pimeloyl-ACP methyl ester carboxylesterase